MNNISFFSNSLFTRRSTNNKNYKISKKQLVSLLALGTIALVGSFILYNRSFQINKIPKLNPLLKKINSVSSLLTGIATIVGVGTYSKYRKTEIEDPIKLTTKYITKAFKSPKAFESGYIATPPIDAPAEVFKSSEEPITHVKQHIQQYWKQLDESTEKAELEQSEKELEQGMEIPEKAIELIECNLPSLSQKEGIKGFENYQSSTNNSRIFSLDEFPELIFKLYLSDNGGEITAKNRYKKMLWAQAVCRHKELGLLKVPNAKFLTIERDSETLASVIVERKLNIPSRLKTEDKFNECNNLEAAVSQLATFICETGYSDVEFRNNPPMEESDEDGNRKIALIDLEEMNSVRTGLFGEVFSNRSGLVGCLNKEQGRIVEQRAQEYGVNTDSFIEAYNRRIEGIHEDEKLREYHTNRGITVGNEPIKEIGNEDISFHTDRETQLKCTEIANELIKFINTTIKGKPAESSIKYRRIVTVEPCDDLGIVIDMMIFKKIIERLVNQKIIYKLRSSNYHGFHIQA